MARRFRIVLAVVLALFVATVEAARNDDVADLVPSGRYLTGQLLIAAPRMSDPRFAHTVIYMVSHDAKGAMGLVINRAFGTGPLRILLRTMGVDAEEGEEAGDDVRLQYGGPVEPQRGFVLHSLDYEGESTQRVRRGVAVSFGSDVLKAMAEGRGPSRSVVVLGYAGWGPGQLESELNRDDWLTAPASESLIFSDDLDTLWDRAMETAGTTL